MQSLSQPFPKPAHASDTKEQENQQTTKQRNKEKEEKAVCIIGGESEALGFHQKIQERRNDHKIRKKTRGSQLVLYKNITLFPSCTKLTIAQC